MRDFSHLPSCTLEMLRGSRPSGPGPIRISLNDVSEHERPGIYREFFGSSVFRTDIEPLRDHPFEVDVTLRRCPAFNSSRASGSARVTGEPRRSPLTELTTSR
jgi:hypothetical protein